MQRAIKRSTTAITEAPDRNMSCHNVFNLLVWEKDGYPNLVESLIKYECLRKGYTTGSR